MLASLALIAGVAAAPALADNADFVEGTQLYNAFEFEKASFRFRSASRSAILPPAEVARANLWLGLALGQAGDEISARAAFVDALRLDGSLILPDDAPPTLRPVFSDARSSVLAGATPASSVDAPATPPSAGGAAEVAPAGAPGLSMVTIVGISLVGGGALVIAGGIGTGALALAQVDAARQQHFQDDARAAEAEADRTAMIANVLFIVGGATVAGGVGAVVAAPFVE